MSYLMCDAGIVPAVGEAFLYMLVDALGLALIGMGILVRLIKRNQTRAVSVWLIRILCISGLALSLIYLSIYPLDWFSTGFYVIHGVSILATIVLLIETVAKNSRDDTRRRQILTDASLRACDA